MMSPSVSPFKLLQPYYKEDARMYFGRSQEARRLAETLLRSKFILLYGASGTGKTSLIRCGLEGVFSPRDWLPIFVRRGDNFPESLKTTVLEHYSRRLALRYPGQTLDYPADISLRVAIQRLFQVSCLPVYLILDQFEEIFTVGSAEEQKAFFQCLKDLRLFEEDLFCKMLIVTREEYIAHFYDYEKEIPFLFDHRFRVEKMRRTQLSEVITGTLTAPYPGYPPFRLSEDGQVAEQIIENLTDERGEVDLTTLQVYLDRLYREDVERAPDRAYRFFDMSLVGQNKLSNVLSDFLEEQIKRVGEELTGRVGWSVDANAVARWPFQILFKLVTSQGTKQHRTAAEIYEALQAGRLSMPLSAVQACLERMAAPDIRLLNRLRFEKDGADRYEMAHDHLAKQVFGKFNAEEVRQREALSTLDNKLKRFGEAAGQSEAARRAEYLTPGEIALVEQSLDPDYLPAERRAFLQDSRTYHRRKRQRERRIAVFSSVAAVVFLGVALLAFVQWRRADRARQVEYLVSKSLLQSKTDATGALRHLQAALALSPDNKAALAARHDIYSNNEFYEKSFVHPAPVKGVFMSRDSSQTLFSWTEQSLYRWHREGRRADSIAIPDLTSAALSPDGRMLAVGTAFGTLYYIEANDFSRRQRFQLTDSLPVSHLAFGTHPRTLAAASGYEVFVLPAATTGTFASVLRIERAVSALSIHPRSNHLLIGYEDGLTELRTMRGKLIKREKRHEDRVLGFSTDPGDGSLTSVGRDGQLVFWKNNLHVQAHQPRANNIQWSPDSSRVFTCGDDYTLKSWSPEGTLIAVYRGHAGFVNGLSVSPDGQYVASAGEDRVVRFWKTESKVAQRYGPHLNGVSGIAVSGGQQQNVITVSDQGKNDTGERINNQNVDFDALLNSLFSLFPRDACIWNIRSGMKIKTLDGHQGGINALAVNADGSLIATASDDASVILRDAQGNRLRTLSGGHKGKILDVAFSPDGQQCLTAGEDKLCILWTINGQPLRSLPLPDVVACVAFFPDGQRFATGCYDGLVRIHNALGDSLQTLAPKNLRHVECMAISPDGRYLVSGEWGKFARIWNTQGDSVAVVAMLSGNKTGASAIHALAFSPDGRHIAIGAEGGLAQIYRMTDSGPLLLYTLQHYPKRTILALRFTSDGKGIFTGSNDHWARYWRLE